MDDSLKSLLELLEDEETDPLSKWRNICYTLLVKNKDLEIQECILKKKSDESIKKLNDQLGSLQKELDEKNKLKEELELKLEDIKQMEQSLLPKMEGISNSVLLANSRAFINNRCLILRKNCENICKSLSPSLKESEKFDDRIKKLQEKVKKYTDLYNKRTHAKRELLFHGNELRKKLESLEIPDYPKELISLIAMYREEEAINQYNQNILAIEELNTKISACERSFNALSDRSAEISSLNQAIYSERKRQEDVLEKLKEEYNTESIEDDVRKIKKRVMELENKYEKENEEARKIIDDIESERTEAVTRLKKQIEENKKIIEELENRKVALQFQLPERSDAKKVSTGTNCIVVGSLFD